MTRAKSKPQQTYTTDVHGFSHDGRGIATIHGMTTFIAGALPSENVICQIQKRHRNYQEAMVTEILMPSPDRTAHECAHFNICGGCSVQHLTVDQQIQYKQKSLLEQLQHFGKVIPQEVLLPMNGKSLGYRRRARLGVRYVRKKEQVYVGFREKMTHFLTKIDACAVLVPSIGLRITEITALITSLSQFEHIPQIEVAVGDTASALMFRHMVPLPTEDLQKLIAFGQQHQLHIYLQPNQPEPVTLLWPQNTSDLLSYSLSEYGIEIDFHPTDFVQINAEINQQLIKQAITLLDPQPTETALDLFCGLGNFTLPLSRFVKQVTGIEGGIEMVERARHNAAKNQIQNADFFTANLMNPESSCSWLQKKYDKIILDPPRTGAKEIIPHLAALAAKSIVYVSCNPATLARDAGELAKIGYKLTKTGIINMFPHTSHIEAIALFKR